eukprot:3986213-Amphidinium_carterae.1
MKDLRRIPSWEGVLSRGRKFDGQGEQSFTWDEAHCKVKWDSAPQLCKEVSGSRLDFQGLVQVLRQALRQLKLDGQSQKNIVILLLLVEFGMKFVPTLSLTLAKSAAERREVELPASTLAAPPCVKLHGLLPAPPRQNLGIMAVTVAE